MPTSDLGSSAAGQTNKPSFLFFTKTQSNFEVGIIKSKGAFMWPRAYTFILHLYWDCEWLIPPVKVVSVHWPGREGKDNLPYQLNNLHLHRRKLGSMSPTHHCTAHLYIEPMEKERGRENLSSKIYILEFIIWTVFVMLLLNSGLLGRDKNKKQKKGEIGKKNENDNKLMTFVLWSCRCWLGFNHVMWSSVSFVDRRKLLRPNLSL